MNTLKTPRSAILWTGPSLLDGSPIIVVGIGASSNRKTGDMLQTYIIRADMAPIEASRSGADAAICGDCPHRQGQGGSCYVTLAHGPSSVWRTLQRDAYPALFREGPREETRRALLAEFGEGRMVRLGTYGDPAAVPEWVWTALVSRASGWTGYTHQWRRSLALQGLVMASVDSIEEATQARAMGWRTFRIRDAAEPLLAREMVCPASEEAGKRLQCAECRACDGARKGPTDNRASVAIVVHGALKRRFIPIRPA
jgi:hypothetical protein